MSIEITALFISALSKHTYKYYYYCTGNEYQYFLWPTLHVHVSNVFNVLFLEGNTPTGLHCTLKPDTLKNLETLLTTICQHELTRNDYKQTNKQTNKQTEQICPIRGLIQKYTCMVHMKVYCT